MRCSILSRLLHKISRMEMDTTPTDVTVQIRLANQHFDNPFWTVIISDMHGPRFDNDRPDMNEHIQSCQYCIEEIEKLAAALKTVAFP